MKNRNLGQRSKFRSKMEIFKETEEAKFWWLPAKSLQN